MDLNGLGDVMGLAALSMARTQLSGGKARCRSRHSVDSKDRILQGKCNGTLEGRELTGIEAVWGEEATGMCTALDIHTHKPC